MTVIDGVLDSTFQYVHLAELSPELARKVVCFEAVSFVVDYFRCSKLNKECHISSIGIQGCVRKQKKLQRFILERWHLDWGSVTAYEVRNVVGQLAKMNPEWQAVTRRGGHQVRYMIPNGVGGDACQQCRAANLCRGSTI